MNNARRRRWLWCGVGAIVVLGLIMLGEMTVAPWRVSALFVHSDGGQATEHRPPRTIAEKIVAGAREQVGTNYSPGYVKIDYPMGDLPRTKGVCTDVVVRALRRAGCDLQQLIHEDMAAHFADYPQKWGASGPDTNIDHRRVPNQTRFFRRHGVSLTRRVASWTLDEWQPGDIVYWKVDGGLDHCGVVSDKRNRRGIPYVIHNLYGCAEQDCLTDWEIVGHYRYPNG